MPLLQIYLCCGVRQGVLDSPAVPRCPTCRGPMTWKQTRDYNPVNHGWSTGRKAPALDFNQTAGRVAPIGEHGIPINSLHDIRRIERESEKRARDGVGEQYVFRKYAQDANHLHDHTLGAAPEAAPSQAWLRQHVAEFGQVREAISRQEADRLEFGPGMTSNQPAAFGD